MFQDRQPIDSLVPTLMPDAELMHSFHTFAQVNLSFDRLGSLATVRNDRSWGCQGSSWSGAGGLLAVDGEIVPLYVARPEIA